MDKSPLAPDILFSVGPVPIDRAVATTWAIMAILVGLSWLGAARAKPEGGGIVQTVLEIVVETAESQVRDVMRRDPWPYVPLLCTLFLYLFMANLSGEVPGARSPTAHIETPAALAVIVFFSVHYFGIRSKGVRGYLVHYVKPTPLLLPLNVLSEFTRVFALMVRLFGNIMSHELILAVALLLAGLLLPIPFMLLGILIGIIQAYIFAVLAAVFIGAAVGAVQMD
jgi:F-type H+-transporting ATPase subunit a